MLYMMQMNRAVVERHDLYLEALQLELRHPDRRYRPGDRSPVVMYRAGSLRLALRAGPKLSKEGVPGLETLPGLLLFVP